MHNYIYIYKCTVCTNVYFNAGLRQQRTQQRRKYYMYGREGQRTLE